MDPSLNLNVSGLGAIPGSCSTTSESPPSTTGVLLAFYDSSTRHPKQVLLRKVQHQSSMDMGGAGVTPAWHQHPSGDN